MPWFRFRKSKQATAKPVVVEVTHEYNVTHEYRRRGVEKATQTEEHLLDPLPISYYPVRTSSLKPLITSNRGPLRKEEDLSLSRSNSVRIPTGASAEVQKRLERLSPFQVKARRALSRVGDLLGSKRFSIPSAIIEVEEVSSSIP